MARSLVGGVFFLWDTFVVDLLEVMRRGGVVSVMTLLSDTLSFFCFFPAVRRLCGCASCLLSRDGTLSFVVQAKACLEVVYM